MTVTTEERKESTCSRINNYTKRWKINSKVILPQQFLFSVSNANFLPLCFNLYSTDFSGNEHAWVESEMWKEQLLLKIREIFPKYCVGVQAFAILFVSNLNCMNEKVLVSKHGIRPDYCILLHLILSFTFLLFSIVHFIFLVWWAGTFPNNCEWTTFHEKKTKTKRKLLQVHLQNKEANSCVKHTLMNTFLHIHCKNTLPFNNFKDVLSK